MINVSPAVKLVVKSVGIAETENNATIPETKRIKMIHDNDLTEKINNTVRS